MTITTGVLPSFVHHDGWTDSQQSADRRDGTRGLVHYVTQRMTSAVAVAMVELRATNDLAELSEHT